MPRVARLDTPGLLQHVIVRGVERREIFSDDRDRGRFLVRLASLLQETETSCYAWALIPNHFHLLLMPIRYQLAVLMRRLLTGHAVTFNLIHGRAGHLFQNRYKSIVCDKENYLLELVRYIHLNPIRAGLVRTVEELDRFPWSGHSVLMGFGSLEGQEVDEVLGHFGGSLIRARGNYRDFVADGLAMGQRGGLPAGGGSGRPDAMQESAAQIQMDSRILGDREFTDRILSKREFSEKGRHSRPLCEWTDIIASVLKLDARAIRQPSKNRSVAEARGIISYIGIRELGCKGLAIGRELNLGPGGVSIALRRGESILRERSELREEILGKIAK
jgi:putative transposase